MALRLYKTAAAAVIAIGLGTQTYAILRPSGARLWPFVDYPMYSSSHEVGDVVRGRIFYAIGCDGQPQRWRFESHVLGYQGAWLGRQLRAIGRHAPAAASARAEIAHTVSRLARPRPCALELHERTITITPDGIDAPSLDQAPERLLARWSVVHPPTAGDGSSVDDAP